MPRAVRIRGDEPETERRAKRRNLAGEGEEEEEEEEEGTALCSTSPRSPGEPAVRTSHPEMIFAIFEPDKAESEAKQDRVCDDVAESLTEESFDPPSPPVYEPYIPDELAADPHALADLKHAKAKYKAEKARRANLFTMDHYCYEAPSCLFDDHRLLPIRQPAKDAVLLAAKSVILFSSFLGSQRLNKCNGLWFQRDEQRKTALVLTSAHLIREKDPSVKNHWKLQWTGKYHRDTEVIVHLLDKGAAPGRLVYLQEHYEFALYEVEVDKPVQLPTFNDCVRSGQNVFRLGRDANLDLKITHGMVAYEIPSCCMPRLHLGMTFTSIKHLDPISIDRMTHNHNIESGLIVEQVSKGSHAEKIGIREGDVIESFNGKYISTTIELEKMLVDICWDHFEQKNALYAEKDVSVKIFDAIKHRRRTRNLTVIGSWRGHCERRLSYHGKRSHASLL